jgi:ferrochelatase
MNRIAVVLFNLGGPDSIDAVEPFLYNLFTDPDIISIPLGFLFRKPLARMISKKRSKFVREEYSKIGGKSPINEWTEKQRSMLEDSLRNTGLDADVYTAMRYWNPLIGETAGKVASKEYSRIILLPLYPHFSRTTTGSSFAEWKRVYTGNEPDCIYITDYYEFPKYIEALNQRITESIDKFSDDAKEDVELVFSAHGIPESLIKKGDPYKDHTEKTVKAIMELKQHDYPFHLCFQSKVGPMKWLEPSTESTISELALKGKKNLLIIPVSFVSDHIETLVELDIQYRKTAESAGIENYIVMKGLNDSPVFIEALTEIVSGQL